ncbi:MAG TPA: S46 family peptidase [Holophagaceae bacterium]|nr:S46 family peptidase [Holophagaceae bacterium]
MKPFRGLTLSLLAFALAGGALRADEGMWTFDNVPVQKMKAKYGFAPDQAWLDHLRLSALRFPGGSGSFISADGLVLTNHHVGRGSIQQLSGPGKDYIKNGFYAATRDAELKVPGLELYTLMAMDDVTARVNKAAAGAKDDKAALKARENELEAIKKEMEAKSHLTCQSVNLYQGGEYWIYSYKKHTDVRLVFAPEQQIAFFGGDPDNFTFPRHNLDFSLFRVYEDGKPYHPAQHLQFTHEGVKAGDMTFVTGHPGSTSRLQTVAQMRYARDIAFPLRLKSLEGQIAAMQAYAATSEEHARQVGTQIFGLQNAQKAITGYWSGLKDKEAMARIEAAEKELRDKVAKDPELAARAGQSWTRIEGALAAAKAMSKEVSYLNTANSTLLGYALDLVRLPAEEVKANDNRLVEFKDSNLKGMKARLLVPRPFYPEMEEANFTFGLQEALDGLGANHPFVKAMLGGKSPAEAAKAAVEGSKLGDPAVRKALLEGGQKAIDASTDPMLLLARKLDPMGRELRKKQEEQVASVLTEQGGRIAQARFKVYGKTTYPDATFTLRLSYGAVESYPANGTKIQPFTTFGGLYDRYDGWGGNAVADKVEHGAWALPQRWVDRRSAVNPSTPFDFVHSNDIIGGNSGSPVVDKKGELVGLIFDGNIESLPGNYFYDGRVNRSVSVDALAIIEALRKVYDAAPLADEIMGGSN